MSLVFEIYIYVYVNKHVFHIKFLIGLNYKSFIHGFDPLYSLFISYHTIVYCAVFLFCNQSIMSFIEINLGGILVIYSDDGV